MSGDTNSDPPLLVSEQNPHIWGPWQTSLRPFPVTLPIVRAGSVLRPGTHRRQSGCPVLAHAVARSRDHRRVTAMQQTVQDRRRQHRDSRLDPGLDGSEILSRPLRMSLSGRHIGRRSVRLSRVRRGTCGMGDTGLEPVTPQRVELVL